MNRQMNRTSQRNRVVNARRGLDVGMLSLAAVLAMVPVGVRAAPGVGGVDVVWDGSDDGLWVTPSNWDGNAVPTSADNVFLPAPAPVNNTIALPSGAVGNEMTVDGSYTLSGGDLTLSQRLWIAPTAGGTVSLTGSSTLTAPSVTVGVDDASALGVLAVGSGSTLAVSGNLGLGYGGFQHVLSVDGTVTAGSFTVGGITAGVKNNAFTIGASGSLTSTGTLMLGYEDNVNYGTVAGTLNTGATQLGNLVGSDSNRLSISPGGTFTATDTIIVGLAGSFNQLINEGGTISMTTAGKDFVVGHDAGANFNSGAVNSGGSLSVNGGFYVGKGGGGNAFYVGNPANPASTGTLTSTVGRIGHEADSNGNLMVVTNPGSEWTVNGALRVGGSGSNNSLNIESGGVVTVPDNRNVWVGYAGTSGGNEILVSGTGSLLDIQGTGELTLSNTATAGDLNVVGVSDGGHINTAKVNLGPSSALVFGGFSTLGTSGTISASAPIIGAGTGDLFTPGSTPSIVAFLQTDATFTLPNTIEGSASVLVLSAGTTVLTGANTYTGSTLVQGGTLQLSAASNNIASSSSILTVPGATFDVSTVTGGFSLGAGQVLEGRGSVIGDVDAPAGTTIRGGAELFGGPGLLTFTDNLTMQGGSNLNVSILSENLVPADQTNAGTLWSMVQVDGTLSLTGLDIVPLAINLENLNAIPNGTNTWAILGAAGGIDFNGAAVTPYTDYTSYFDVRTFASNGMAGWNGSLEGVKVISLGDSNTLYLQATSVPEPGQTMAVLVVGGFLGGRVLRRRRTV
jgi:T5SS/PEP-CTERM-associated repeat protein/autotransporter-associated beta strand protein